MCLFDLVFVVFIRLYNLSGFTGSVYRYTHTHTHFWLRSPSAVSIDTFAILLLSFSLFFCHFFIWVSFVFSLVFVDRYLAPSFVVIHSFSVTLPFIQSSSPTHVHNPGLLFHVSESLFFLPPAVSFCFSAGRLSLIFFWPNLLLALIDWSPLLLLLFVSFFLGGSLVSGYTFFPFLP